MTQTVKITPLSDKERGRGSVLSAERMEEVLEFCEASISLGVSQREIALALGASTSRTSRWCISALKKNGLRVPHHKLKMRDATIHQAVFARIGFKNPSECWGWKGFVKPNGYGSFNWKGKTSQAHRLVYSLFVGRIPDGMVIDHTCENKSCVNPAHLNPVFPCQNLMLKKARSEGYAEEKAI